MYNLYNLNVIYIRIYMLELLSYKGQKIKNNRGFSLFHPKLIRHVRDPHPFIFSLCPCTASTHKVNSQSNMAGLAPGFISHDFT